jgi:nucleoside 2-deoxyribosyltransferase
LPDGILAFAVSSQSALNPYEFELGAHMSPEDAQMAFQGVTGELPRVFFAYPSQPRTLSETIREAAAEINKARVVNVRTWEEMAVTGKNVIQEICREINESQIFCVDLTGLNPNVLFELGYAIARDKRIWPIFDTSFPELRKRFDELRLLTTTGFAPYTNSEDILRTFLREKPYLDVENTIFRKSIQPSLSPRDEEILFYLKSQLDTNAGIRISKTLNDSDIPVIVDDPTEAGIQTLTWYGQKAYSAAAVVTHLLGERQGSEITNAKHSLISGLAHGFGKPLLMLADLDYTCPLDYSRSTPEYLSRCTSLSLYALSIGSSQLRK